MPVVRSMKGEEVVEVDHTVCLHLGMMEGAEAEGEEEVTVVLAPQIVTETTIVTTGAGQITEAEDHPHVVAVVTTGFVVLHAGVTEVVVMISEALREVLLGDLHQGTTEKTMGG